MSCILCAIANGQEPAELIYEDDEAMAITPLRPMTPIHVLLFPREHSADLPAYLADSAGAAARLMRRAADLASHLGLTARVPVDLELRARH